MTESFPVIGTVSASVLRAFAILGAFSTYKPEDLKLALGLGVPVPVHNANSRFRPVPPVFARLDASSGDLMMQCGYYNLVVMTFNYSSHQWLFLDDQDRKTWPKDAVYRAWAQDLSYSLGSLRELSGDIDHVTYDLKLGIDQSDKGLFVLESGESQQPIRFHQLQKTELRVMRLNGDMDVDCRQVDRVHNGYKVPFSGRVKEVDNEVNDILREHLMQEFQEIGWFGGGTGEWDSNRRGVSFTRSVYFSTPPRDGRITFGTPEINIFAACTNNGREQ